MCTHLDWQHICVTITQILVVPVLPMSLGDAVPNVQANLNGHMIWISNTAQTHLTQDLVHPFMLEIGYKPHLQQV